MKILINKIRSFNITDISNKTGVARSSIHRFIKGESDMSFSNIEKIFSSQKRTLIIIDTPIDSVLEASQRIIGGTDWRVALMDFVDTFRRTKDAELIKRAPNEDTPAKEKALIYATVAVLCKELGIEKPNWVYNTRYALKEPWFVAGMESLKPMALVQSPLEFRNMNIFVLDNFLSRV